MTKHWNGSGKLLMRDIQKYTKELPIYIFSLMIMKEKIPPKALNGMEKAAACGRPYNLAICYRNGTGVKKNYKKVVELCMICAEGGRGADGPLALLALCYCNGEGVKKNKKTAREYCMKTFTMMGVEESEIDSIETSGVGVGLAKWILDYIGK